MLVEMATNPHQELVCFHSCSDGQSVYSACTLEIACDQRGFVSLSISHNPCLESCSDVAYD